MADRVCGSAPKNVRKPAESSRKIGGFALAALYLNQSQQNRRETSMAERNRQARGRSESQWHDAPELGGSYGRERAGSREWSSGEGLACTGSLRGPRTTWIPSFRRAHLRGHQRPPHRAWTSRRDRHRVSGCERRNNPNGFCRQSARETHGRRHRRERVWRSRCAQPLAGSFEHCGRKGRPHERARLDGSTPAAAPHSAGGYSRRHRTVTHALITMCVRLARRAGRAAPIQTRRHEGFAAGI